MERTPEHVWANGRSSRPPVNTLTLEQPAADADAPWDHLGLEKVAVLGTSSVAALRYNTPCTT
jgi:hypothetical protein